MAEMPGHAIYALHDGSAPDKERFAGWFTERKWQGIRFYGLTQQAVREAMKRQWEVWQAEGEKARAARAKRTEAAKRRRLAKRKDQTGDGTTHNEFPEVP